MAHAYEVHPHSGPGPEPRPYGPPRHAPTAPAALAILRIGAGLLFMQHGVQKLFGGLGGVGPDGGTVPLMSLMGLAGVLETFGGLMIVLGLLTRLVAPVLAIEMLFAFFMAHAPRGGAPVQNGGELPLLYALVFVGLTFLGAGPWSFDHRLRAVGMRHD
jgi:putative oxidoreductase